MSDYAQEGNRWTMVMIKQEDGTLKRATFDLVRFNVDTDPNSKPVIVPVGSGGDNGKKFERVWTVEEQPYKTQFFGGI